MLSFGYLAWGKPVVKLFSFGGTTAVLCTWSCGLRAEVVDKSSGFYQTLVSLIRDFSHYCRVVFVSVAGWFLHVFHTTYNKVQLDLFNTYYLQEASI